jgi:hypothetical protein
MPLTVRGRSLSVRVRDVSTKMESGMRSSVEIQFSIDDPPSPMGVGFQSGTERYSAEDLIELRLSEQLFGEQVSAQHAFFWCDFEIDRGVLTRADLADGTAAALTRLLITEALVGGGYVGSVRRVDVGPRRSDGRRVTVTWTDREVYTNVEPATRTVTGVLRP